MPNFIHRFIDTVPRDGFEIFFIVSYEMVSFCFYKLIFFLSLIFVSCFSLQIDLFICFYKFECFFLFLPRDGILFLDF